MMAAASSRFFPFISDRETNANAKQHFASRNAISCVSSLKFLYNCILWMVLNGMCNAHCRYRSCMMHWKGATLAGRPQTWRLQSLWILCMASTICHQISSCHTKFQWYSSTNQTTAAVEDYSHVDPNLFSTRRTRILLRRSSITREPIGQEILSDSTGNISTFLFVNSCQLGLEWRRLS